MLPLRLQFQRLYFFFFFNDTATTEIYTLSLHDALPIFAARKGAVELGGIYTSYLCLCSASDRKSTRLNSSHTVISYAVFCLKKKKQILSHGRVRVCICDVGPVLFVSRALSRQQSAAGIV